MFNRIQIREIFAWMALAIAFLLFSATIVFSQTKTINVQNEEGNIHIIINKTENGKSTIIDTTFKVTDDMNVDEIIESLDSSENGNGMFTRKSEIHKYEKGNKKGNQITMDFDMPKMSRAEKEKLHKEWNKSMKVMKDGIEKMTESLKKIHIHIDTDEDKGGDFYFNFDSPDGETDENSNCKGYSYSYKLSQDDENVIDSLDDDDHIVIVGGKDEKPPELEKVISTKKGKQIFVYKRSDLKPETDKSKNVDQKKGNPNIRNLDYFPNPTNGKFKLTFHSDERGDINIQILDANSKVIYSENTNDFEGEYSKEIDLGNKSKGNYFLKIIQNDKSFTKKIVLN